MIIRIYYITYEIGSFQFSHLYPSNGVGSLNCHWIPSSKDEEIKGIYQKEIEGSKSCHIQREKEGNIGVA